MRAARRGHSPVVPHGTRLVSCRGFCRGLTIRLPPYVWLCLPALVLAGCGSKASATVKPPHKKQPVAATAATVQTYPTAVVALATAAPTVAPTSTSAPDINTEVPPTVGPTSVPSVQVSVQPGRVASASVQPASASPGSTLTASVHTTGAVDRVEVYLSAGPGGGAPVTFTLSAIAPGVWSAAGTAPSTAGSYHYSVGLYTAGRRTVVDADSWNVTVTGPAAAAGQAQTLPADVPLAPPFSYGNPAPAVFTAAGHTINGSEVVSTTRSDVPPSSVSTWYAAHLPRAGWSVDQSTFPAAGATAFTMVGTSGARAVVVEYSGYTVHVFYGSYAA